MTKVKGPKRPNDWSAEEKLKVVMEADSLEAEQLGEFLRKKGLHQTHLEQWRLQMLDGLQDGFSKKKTGQKKADSKRIRALEKELRRKDKALAETATLLVLKKKVQQIWGDEDEPTIRSNAK
jgi:transposase-like protein